MHEQRHVVVQVGESDSVFRAHRLTDDDLVDVVELVPVFITQVVIFNQRFELRSTWNRHVEGFRGEKTLRIEKIEEIAVDKIGE